MAKHFRRPVEGRGRRDRSLLGRKRSPVSECGSQPGADALLGLPGDIWHGARYLANRALGYKDPINDILPTSESLRKRREEFAGPDYQPETTAGKYAQTIGEFLPGAALASEESIGKGLVKFGVVPGAASDWAGQLTQGTPIEPYARVVGAVGGGLAPAVGQVAKLAGKSFLEPFSEEGRQNIAARGLRDAFTDPRQAQIDLEAAKATQQPGAGMGETFPDRGRRPAN